MTGFERLSLFDAMDGVAGLLRAADCAYTAAWAGWTGAGEPEPLRHYEAADDVLVFAELCKKRLPHISREERRILFEEWRDHFAGKCVQDRMRAVDVLARDGTCVEDRIEAADFLARYAEEQGIPFRAAASPREN